MARYRDAVGVPFLDSSVQARHPDAALEGVGRRAAPRVEGRETFPHPSPEWSARRGSKSTLLMFEIWIFVHCRANLYMITEFTEFTTRQICENNTFGIGQLKKQEKTRR
jgi:hypothetical protein